MVITAQNVIPAAGHTEGHTEVSSIIPATCTEDGVEQHDTYCKVCNELMSSTTVEIAALGHDMVTDAAIQPTYLNYGLTAGSHCDRCAIVMVEQEILPKLIAPDMLILPRSITIVEEEAYMGCGARSITLSSACERIESKAFALCESLLIIKIPSSVTYIAEDAFEGADQVMIVTSHGTYADNYAVEHKLTEIIIN